MHNRQLRNINSRRNFGGIAVLIKCKVLNDYCVDAIDKSIDGLFVFKIRDKVSNYTIILIACYLPPERSPWGRDAGNFFSHILNLIYLHSSSCDAVYLCGDLNSRLGDKQDYIKGIDNITDRQILDKSYNKHGEAFYEFLTDSKMCVINGRISPHNNDFTFVSTRGKSVVDYFTVPMDNLHTCLDFTVTRPLQLISQTAGTDSVHGELLSIDHSLLTLVVVVHSQSQTLLNSAHNDNISVSSNPVYDQSHVPQSYFTRYKNDQIITDPFGSSVGSAKLLKLISDIENFRGTQMDIDNIYLNLCNLYHNEMSLWFKSINVQPSSKKRLKRISKPFWNDTLQLLLNDLQLTEKQFVKARGGSRPEKRKVFKAAQKRFDREFRKEERRYKRNKESEIEALCTSNPKEFWKLLKELGPRKKTNKIPMETYDNFGNICDDVNFVFEKWRGEYNKLYNPSDECENYDNEFQDFCLNELTLEGNEEGYDDLMDSLLSAEEVRKILTKAKCKKAVGIDNIPNEILKNEKTISLLTNLFNKIFANSLMPSCWNIAIIKPIPKSSLLDHRIPLQYRGISLLSTLYKIFTTLLNNRLSDFVDQNIIYNDEQNGFRKKRSCAEHIYTLTSIIRNRKAARKPTFVAYIDFEKAFDRVNRNLLFYKLRKYGVKGKLFKSLAMIYEDAKAGVELNGAITNWFGIKAGVRQGDPLSPTLFGLFINDLVDFVKESAEGIKTPEFSVQCLLFADDLVLISENESDLQKMLDSVDKWCSKWRMTVNVNKSKIVHYRGKDHMETGVVFKLAGNVVEKVSYYNYLGLILDYSLDFSKTAKVLGISGGRALGAIINKYISNKGLAYKTYTKMYDMMVCPILDYCACVWGYNQLEFLSTVQNRAIRFFLGVNKFAPNLGINGEVGWIPRNIARKVDMIKFWNRMIGTQPDRLLKKVFLWDKRLCKKNWSSEIKKLCFDLNLLYNFNNNVYINPHLVKERLCCNYMNQWKRQISVTPKLRFFDIFKVGYRSEHYVNTLTNRSHRSLLAQLRLGILPLRIETGRYEDIPIEYRFCLYCNQNCIESEFHFMLYCDKYNEIRYELFNNVRPEYPLIDIVEAEDQIKMLMSDNVIYHTATYICKAFDLRNSSTFV